jgi:hypothetical protein
MGKKLDEAYYRLLSESNHHNRLAQARGTDTDNQFAMGFWEALQIVVAIRDGKIIPTHLSVDSSIYQRPTARRARGRRGTRK